MTFDRIYRENLWNGIESASGPGSGVMSTFRIAPQVAALARDLMVTSVTDVGCGDSFWMPDLPGYTGIDVSIEAVNKARERHPDRDFIIGRPTDAPADLMICRDVLQHLSFADGLALLNDIKVSCVWLLASTYVGTENADIVSGAYYEPDLTAPPFDLPAPELLIFDGYSWDTPDVKRDPRKFLGLWRI